MFQFILVILLAVFISATVVLAIFVAEFYGRGGRTIIRQWRIALSKRRQVNDALKRASAGEAYAARTIQEKRVIEQKMEMLEKKTEGRLSCMGSYIISEQCGDHIKGIRANNYHAKEKKILRSIEVAAKNGYHLPKTEREQLSRMLKQAHDEAIRAEKEKERQAEIRAQMREEEKREREFQRAIKEAEKEKNLKKAALEEAIRLLGDQHSEEVDRLKAELAEAEAKAERTISMAQQTRAGHIYIISNIGSFGKNVFKVGMTRRLEPMERVKELGDASVPFSFDVHAMIGSDDAPTLEAQLHQDLDKHRVNRVNYRKEFFKVDLNTIIQYVRKRHGEVEYQADPEALEYLETLALLEGHEDVEQLIDRDADLQEEDLQADTMER